MPSLHRGNILNCEIFELFSFMCIAQDGGPVNLLNGTGLELSDADSASEAFPSLQVYITYTILVILKFLIV